jgi:hypothetical protein
LRNHFLAVAKHTSFISSLPQGKASLPMCA